MEAILGLALYTVLVILLGALIGLWVALAMERKY